jgi:secreted PhoX family phosphatase
VRTQIIAAAVGATALLGLGTAAHAATGPIEFDPIPGSAYGQASDSWDVPYLLPEGYTQTLVKDESVLDVYPGTADLHDMNTQNETGYQAGRYLYNTYEVGAGGALAVTDLQTGDAKVIARDADFGFEWNRLDGIRWTPWGTLLFDEETAGGHVYEAFFAKNDPTTIVDIQERSEIGILRHEGVDVGADGSVYVIDELNGGSIYRFVPTVRGDLSAGQLYALKLTGLSDAEQLWSSATFGQKVGAFEWVALDQSAVSVDADAASNAVKATEFGRPEDVEIIGRTLYVANTSEDRVIAIDLAKQTVATFVQAGVNAPVEVKNVTTGFNNPDNLAEGPDGALWIVEDNDFSDIYRASKDLDRDGAADSVELFGSLVDEGAETTGIYFGADPTVMYVSVQHPDKPLADGIWAIGK